MMTPPVRRRAWIARTPPITATMTITTMTNHTHHCTAHHLGFGRERHRPGPGQDYPDNSRATGRHRRCSVVGAADPTVISGSTICRYMAEFGADGIGEQSRGYGSPVTVESGGNAATAAQCTICHHRD